MGGTRLESIDRFRGFAIVTMVTVNLLADVRTVPAWLKHAPDAGLTVADLVAPFFIFAIALTFRQSALRRESKDGRSGAIAHFTRRFLILIGLGAIISAGEALLTQEAGQFSWGVLQSIGGSGLLSLLLIFSPWWIRLCAGLALLGGYQVLLEFFWHDIVMNSSHGGLPGVLGWASMLLVASAVTDLFHAWERRRGIKRHLWLAVGLALLGAGIGISGLVPIAKNSVSSSYVLVSIGASAIVFFVFDLTSRLFKELRDPLILWGQNPLLLYLGHYLLLGLVVLPDVSALHATATPALFLTELVVILGALTAAAFFLDRRRVIVSV